MLCVLALPPKVKPDIVSHSVLSISERIQKKSTDWQKVCRCSVLFWCVFLGLDGGDHGDI